MSANPLLVQIQKDSQDILSTLPTIQNVLDQNSQVITALNSQLVAKNQLISDMLAGRAMTVLDDLPEYGDGKEGLFRWADAGPNLANSDPTKPAPHGSYVWIPADQENGTDATLRWNPAAPYDNLFFFMVLPTPAVQPTMLADIRNYTGLVGTNPQALEMDFQLTWAGKTHNMAYQFNALKKIMSYFKFSEPKDWIPLPSVPFPDLTRPLQIVAEYSIDAQSTTHRAITLNGAVFPVNVTQAATPNPTWANKLTTAVQLDANGLGQPLSIGINKHEIRYL